MGDRLSDEPVFQRPHAPAASDDAGVWGEPALVSAAAADSARAEHRAWVAEQWATDDGKRRLGVFAGLCVVSGLAAVGCAFAKSSLGFASLAVVFGAPVVEEMAKAMGPLMALEKRPWRFGSASSVVLVGIASGFAFALIENLLYFFVYIPAEQLTPGIVLWRLTACTALHVVGAALSCTGLAKAWRKAAADKGEFDATPAVPWFIAAMTLHALYNAGTAIYALAALG